MSRKKPDPSPAPAIPELVELEEATRNITEYKEAYPDVFNEFYGSLIERFNAAVEAAEKAIKGSHVKQDAGPFRYRYTQVKYNADALFEELGQEAFKEYGGVITQVTKYSIDGKRFEAKVAAGAIQPAVVEKVRKEVHYFSGPDKITEVP